MHDRPTIPELLRSVTQLLDTELVPHVSGSRQFYARVAANVLRIVEREIEHEDEQYRAEWQRLDKLLDRQPYPDTRSERQLALWQRNRDLCERIRHGDADAGPYREHVIQHLKATVKDKLLVSNPAWIERPQEEHGE